MQRAFRGLEGGRHRDLVEEIREAGARVLLLGMRMPPNYGPEFTRRYHQVFHQVAAEEQVSLVPFFMDRVAEDKSLMQADGVHPNAEAQPVLLDNVWPALEPMLNQAAKAPVPKA